MSVPTPFWRSVEALNNFVYLVPEAARHYTSIGLKGSWMGYFASRSAPMGAASPELVVATFHGFAPHLVHRALPDAWRFALAARRLGLLPSAMTRLVAGLEERSALPAKGRALAVLAFTARDQHVAAVSPPPGGRPVRTCVGVTALEDDVATSGCLVADRPDVIERVRQVRQEIVDGTTTVADPASAG